MLKCHTHLCQLHSCNISQTLFAAIHSPDRIIIGHSDTSDSVPTHDGNAVIRKPPIVYVTSLTAFASSPAEHICIYVVVISVNLSY